MTVLDVVRLSLVRVDPPSAFGSVLGTPTAARAERRKDERAREVVELMGLTRYRDATIGTLSTGTRRITELACLVALEPSILLLDEPCSGIAQRETEALGELIVGLRRHLDASVIVIEHDIPMVTGVSDRLLAMETGQVIAWSTPQEVVTDPGVVASYLGGDIRAIERSGRLAVPAQDSSGRSQASAV
jgi:ABC-type branched-subunit amino acid transport system ATPase component